MHYKLQRRQDAKLEDHLEMHPKTPQKKTCCRSRGFGKPNLTRRYKRKLLRQFLLLVDVWEVGREMVMVMIRMVIMMVLLM
jgi:hypothetical protein